MDDGLRERIATLTLRGELLARGMDRDFADVKAAAHWQRVPIHDDGTADAGALRGVVDELASDSRWSSDPGAYYDHLRETLERYRASQQRQGPSAIDRLSGARTDSQPSGRDRLEGRRG